MTKHTIQNNNIAISIQNLSLKLNDNLILDNISYEIEEKDFLIIVGTNGSGKSSILKTINSTYKNYSGFVRLKNNNIASITQDIEANIFPELSVIENCKLYLKNLNEEHITQHLKNYHPSLKLRMRTKVSKLSGGEKQSLILALNLLNNPYILLLDEHTSALDPVTADKLMKITDDVVRHNNLTCVMTTHHLDYALNYGNKIIGIKEGKIAFRASKTEKEKLNKEDLVKYCY